MSLIFNLMGPSTETSRRPIPYPEIQENDLSSESIRQILKKGDAVIGWYNLLNVEDFIFAYRVEYERVIEKLQLISDRNGVQRWKILEIYQLNDKAIKALWTDEWSKFGHLYDDESGLSGQPLVFTDITLDEVLRIAHDAEPFYVDDSRYLVEGRKWNS